MDASPQPHSRAAQQRARRQKVLQALLGGDDEFKEYILESTKSPARVAATPPTTTTSVDARATATLSQLGSRHLMMQEDIAELKPERLRAQNDSVVSTADLVEFDGVQKYGFVSISDAAAALSQKTSSEAPVCAEQPDANETCHGAAANINENPGAGRQAAPVSEERRQQHLLLAGTTGTELGPSDLSRSDVPLPLMRSDAGKGSANVAVDAPPCPMLRSSVHNGSPLSPPAIAGSDACSSIVSLSGVRFRPELKQVSDCNKAQSRLREADSATAAVPPSRPEHEAVSEGNVLSSTRLNASGRSYERFNSDAAFSLACSDGLFRSARTNATVGFDADKGEAVLKKFDDVEGREDTASPLPRSAERHQTAPLDAVRGRAAPESSLEELPTSSSVFRSARTDSAVSFDLSKGKAVLDCLDETAPPSSDLFYSARTNSVVPFETSKGDAVLKRLNKPLPSPSPSRTKSSSSLFRSALNDSAVSFDVSKGDAVLKRLQRPAAAPAVASGQATAAAASDGQFRCARNNSSLHYDMSKGRAVLSGVYQYVHLCAALLIRSQACKRRRQRTHWLHSSTIRWT